MNKTLSCATAITVLLLSSLSSFSQINIFKDINDGTVPTASSSPYQVRMNDERMFFVAESPSYGTELWTTDGTFEGTVIVKDITPGTQSSDITTMGFANDTFYFLVNSGLWKTDGTESGTLFVKDVQAAYGYTSCTELNGEFYFSTTNPSILWKTDGTSTGTIALSEEARPSYDMYTFNNAIYFCAASGTTGFELWKTDGTPSGTALLKEISPGVDGSNPHGFKEMGGTLYFNAITPGEGSELWKTNGTAEGTTLVKDIRPGPDGSEPRILYASADGMFINAYNEDVELELWKSDGTTSGTVLISEIVPEVGVSVRNFVKAGDMYYFAASSLGQNYLYMTDGTASGTSRIFTYPNEDFYGLAVLNNTLFFGGSTNGINDAFWKSDGSPDSAEPLKEGVLLMNRNGTGEIFVFNNAVYFVGRNNDHGLELYKSDGTVEGTSILKEINPQGNGEVWLGGTLNGITYFMGNDGIHGGELWRTDGTLEGTWMVKELIPGNNTMNPYYYVFVGDYLYIRESSYYLWRSDGTPEGTIKLNDFPLTGRISALANYNETLFFTEIVGNGSKIWKTDGTGSGTVLIKEFPSTPEIYPLYIQDDKIFFSASDGTHGYEPWQSDGTAEGTFMIKDMNPTGDSYPQRFIAINGVVVFNADDGTNGRQLWATDGTESGTTQLTTIPGSNIYTDGFVINNILYIPRYLSNSSSSELWKTDGTPANTAKINLPFARAGSISSFTELNDELYFILRSTEGDVMFRSDGTSEGTIMVKSDFKTTNFDQSQAAYLRKINDQLFAINIDFDLYNTEIWAVEGSTACRRTSQSDLIASSSIVVNGKLLIAGASQFYGGTELFMFDPAATVCKSEQTINFPALPVGVRALDDPFTVNATATSGLPVTLTSSNPEVASVEGNTITPLSAGTTEITATQSGDDAWEAAAPVSKTLKVDITVSVEDDVVKSVGIFPTPFADYFQLHVRTTDQDAEVSVFNTSGTVVEAPVRLTTNTNHRLGSSWQPGLYILKVKTRNNVVVRKVIKK